MYGRSTENVLGITIEMQKIESTDNAIPRCASEFIKFRENVADIWEWK